MTEKDKRLLLKQAARLTILGTTAERERGKLKKLVEQGVPYNDPKMCNALERFMQTDNEWKQLEAKYIQLRNKI